MPLMASESILLPSISHQHPCYFLTVSCVCFILLPMKKQHLTFFFCSGNTTTICCRVNLIVSTFLSINLLLLHRLKMDRTEHKASLAPSTNHSALAAAELKLTACPLRGGS